MTCMFIDLGGGATMIACSRGSSRKVECAFCKSRTAELLCDAPLRGAKAGKTCDGRMCRSCGFNVDGLDLCPPHRREHDKQTAAAADWFSSLTTTTQDDAPDRGAIDAMFPHWARKWLADNSPPVNAIACEIRDATSPAAAARTVSDVDLKLAEAALAHAPPQTVDTNLYGCTSCPKCKGEHRWPTRHRTIVCDDCGFIQTSGNMPCVHCLGLHAMREACTCGGIVCLECCKCDARAEPPRDERKSVVDATYVEHSRAGGYLDEAKTQTIGEKVAHVLAAPQSRQHGCHWPGCTLQVPPARWGCREHWFTLPKRIRDRIWNAYRVGQEKTLTPSREYLDAADEAQRWIREHLASLRPVVETPRKSFEQAAREARDRDASRRPATCTYCGEPFTFRHESVCTAHPDQSAQAESSDWTGGMSESEFDPDLNT